MEPRIFRFPFIENRPRVLGATSFVSLVFHGLLLGAFGLAIPHKTVRQPEDTGISIDLATMESPAPPQSSALPDTPLIPGSAPKPPKVEASKPEPVVMPKKTDAPKNKPVSPKSESKKTPAKKVGSHKKSAKPQTQGINHGATARNQPAPASQVASKTPVGQTSPPVPAGGSSTPRPPYPELARKRGQEGTVTVRCQVDANGHVTNASLAKSSGFKLLDEAALKTVGKWKFKPGKKDGASVAGTVVVPVQFILQ